ncbi:metalloregulator ArsR/SmtB family transcription factor [Rhodoblastus acidophilus]|uniref:Metalloregulator ArsR/SmtB family transcription factor n=1 Tax=Candidatus Rhodoblastus alkanivorans TaxID=2954117 RepID=A0ABS9Z7V1_9HYPH|nr:metalloregulator ArsR/SmtB family transcription factor [Candidatus Rhodoblastus alkanivorans]MCI4679630.1 metalloregulator ArsR/SmtB family transcription factor [Candidatus Rhodoblastus alkanivorans]MCI4683666.1 metalloregulator ArsR/SmtB family transcription factor [Candidatus Rhodoblastus alkanivorans]MDI4640983.1 metalloregulator ArsR/SmtB family transcription factor [Rhodoblastus acidophilus]
MVLIALKDLEVSTDLEIMARNAHEASEFLKALAHEARLLILCILAEGEKSVGDLETILAQRQSTVSQQLARLRLDGLVTTRREGKNVYYRLANSDIRTILTAIHAVFCERPGTDLLRGAGA